jgi:hypothetical protein
MKKINLLLILALMATGMWGQISGPFGIRVVYIDIDNGETTEQTYRSDSVSAWGYENGNVFVQPAANRPTFSFPMQNLIRFEYPPIVPDGTNGGSADYLVVHVNGQKAAFLLADGFEMNWRSGVLSIKDRNQSQSIGLKAGITFTVEKLSFGYINPGISSTPGQGPFYLVTELFNGLYQYSYSDKCYMSYDSANLTGQPALIFLSDKTPVVSTIDDIKAGKIYINNAIIGNLYY